MFSKPVFVTVYRTLALTSLSVALTVTTARASFVDFSVGGTSATSSIQGTVDSFRAALGGVNNGNSPGPFTSGRREINWDGGGATTATVSGPVLTAFTNTRGSTSETAGDGFLQTPLNDPALTNINKTYSTTFGAFSPQRIFTPVGSNVTDVTFTVPGSNGATPATVRGFGAVLSDVDLPNVTRMEFFDSSNVEVSSLYAAPGTTPNGSLSFLGAMANAGEQIARVRITTGNVALGPNDSNGGRTDVVVMDDFIYSEPRAVPEPASSILAGIGSLSAVGFCMLSRRSANRRTKRPSQLYAALWDAMFYRNPDVGAAGKQRLVSSKEKAMENMSPLAESRRKIIFRDRPRGWRMIALALIAFSPLSTGVAWATINIGTTTVTSMGHSFEPEDPTPGSGHPALVTDFLVNQTQEVGGGAVLPAVTVNLDSDTSISFTVAAPAGEKFLVRLPAGSSANMALSLAWQTGVFDFGTSATFNTSFHDLVGAAPSLPGSSIVGDNNQAFDFVSSTPKFSNDLSFTSVTFTSTYAPRTVGQGPLTYQPAGSIAPFGTTARNANFTISYSTIGKVDPGRFVSLVSVVPGDYNNDGIADAVDYALWRDTLGSTTNLAADGNGNGVIDAGDFEVWRSHFGQTAVNGVGSTSRAAVPEPASSLLLIIGVAGGFWRCRNGSRSPGTHQRATLVNNPPFLTGFSNGQQPGLLLNSLVNKCISPWWRASSCQP